MRISIDCRWMAEKMEGAASGATLLLKDLIMSTTHHHWMLMSNKPIADLPSATHIETLVFGNTLKAAAARSWWYDRTLPDYLRKCKAERFIGFGGIISTTSTVPQLLMLHNRPENQAGFSEKFVPDAWYRKRMVPMMEKADHILVDYKERPGVAAYFENEAYNRKWQETGWFGNLGLPDAATDTTNTLKKQLTDGREYFFCEEGWRNTEKGIAILLAYAAFKKRMQSGLQLVLLGTPDDPEAWQKKLGSFRFKNDVKTVPSGSFSSKELLSQSFACIYLPEREDVSPLISAMQAGVPLIAEPQDVFTAIAGDSILYIGKEPGETLSDRLMQIYRDDSAREQRRRKAMEKSAELTLQNTTAKLLKVIEGSFFR